jgi:hypothetical protein
MPARSLFLSAISPILLLAPVVAHAQRPALASSSLESWHPDSHFREPALSRHAVAVDSSHGRRSDAVSGLLVGTIVGVAATGAFLAFFCGDPDTSCGADEVGRAIVVFVPPPAMIGALIGSLAHGGD